MHVAIARLAASGLPGARRTAVIVPTRGAAEELRGTLENLLLSGSDAIVLPDLLTRADFYERLHAAMPSAPALLTSPEREVLLRRAAREVAASGTAPPFGLRAGLILQMLAFYDELRRREQTLDDFYRLTTERLAPSAETDRGAERLLRQTEFLAAAFAAFERLTHGTGAVDEHGLRTLLLDAAAAPQRAYEQVVITVADQAADARGLYASDFDLLTRLGGVTSIALVATEGMLASGWHERLHDLLPGLEEERCAEGPLQPPILVVPESIDADRRWFVARDREEELSHIVRELKHRAASSHASARPAALERCGVVFQRPLPYLYLARQVFGDGGVPYQAADALPLSAEPWAAAADLVLSFLLAEGNRDSTVALLSSPHFRMSTDAGPASIDAMDELLRDLKFSGGFDRLASIAAESLEEHGTARQKKRRSTLWTLAAAALASARSVAAALGPLREQAPASVQLGALLAFLHSHEVLPDPAEPWAARHMRARAAVLTAIGALRDAHARHDDQPLTVAELTGSLRRWIEAQTFSPRTGRHGIRLLDVSSAAYADLDELRIVGLVESDWPEPARRSIFYPSSILSQLGWAVDAARMTAARARFHDLLALPARRISASTFTLEEDAIVAGSPFLEELESPGLQIERQPPFPAARVFEHEALLQGIAPRTNGERPGGAAEWLLLRLSRTAAADARYHGAAGERDARAYAVSSVERYLECPFKYYASQILKLPEERDEESGLSPLERGHFVHDVFEQFFIQWRDSGAGTITTANVAGAIALFERVVDSRLHVLPEADRPLERTHLLGSAAASGLAERAFAFEIEQGGEVIERLLEHELEGAFQFRGEDGPRRVALRAKADRIDLMADGTLRIVDYKLSRAPKAARALQLSIYGVCAEQALNGRHGRSWKLGRAGYVAFKEKDPFVPLGGRMSLTEAVADGEKRFLAAVDAIERGEFPVTPDEPFRCRWCAYAGVCRKDYVGDE